MTSRKYHIALPFCTQYLHFSDLIVLLKVSKLWQAILREKTSHLYVNWSHNNDDQIASQRFYLEQFTDVKDLYMTLLNWNDKLMQKSVLKLLRKVRILTIDELMIEGLNESPSESAPNSDSIKEIDHQEISMTDIWYVKLSKLSIYRYNGIIQGLHSHFISPYQHTLQYLVLENIFHLSNDSLYQIMTMCKELRGLHVSMCFLLTCLDLTLSLSPLSTEGAEKESEGASASASSPDNMVVRDIYQSAHHLHGHYTPLPPLPSSPALSLSPSAYPLPPHTPSSDAKLSLPHLLRTSKLTELTISKCPNFSSFLFPLLSTPSLPPSLPLLPVSSPLVPPPAPSTPISPFPLSIPPTPLAAPFPPPLSALPAHSLSSLHYLDLSFTSLSSSDLSLLSPSLPLLSKLYLNQCLSLRGDLTLHLPCLSSVQCMNNTHLLSLSLSSPSLGYVKVSQNMNLTYLAVRGGKVCKLDLSLLQELVYVDLTCPHLTQVNFCGCRKLFTYPDLLSYLPAAHPTPPLTPSVYSLGVFSPYRQVTSPSSAIAFALDQLFSQCPLVNREELFQWNIANTLLFDLKDSLMEKYVMHKKVGRSSTRTRERKSVGEEKEEMQSPKRLSEVRKRFSFA